MNDINRIYIGKASPEHSISTYFSRLMGLPRWILRSPLVGRSRSLVECSGDALCFCFETRQGMDGLGVAGHGIARPGAALQGTAWTGVAWLGYARQG